MGDRRISILKLLKTVWYYTVESFLTVLCMFCMAAAYIVLTGG